MKYRFLLLSSLLASATVFAQAPAKRVKIAPETSKQLTPGQAPVQVNEGSSSGLTEEVGPTLFSDDFSNGLAQWANTSLNSSGAVWVYRGPSTTPSNTVGSQGAYAGTTGTIDSETPSNGFIIFDSDWYDNGGTAGNFGGGTEPAPHAGAITSPTIDCSTEDNVLLTFNSFFRQFDAHGWVMVSTDNFATMDTVYDASEFHDVNAAGPSDEFVKLDISATAGGQSSVQVRFLFESAGNANPSGYYFWQLDDIAVVGAADFDLGATETFFFGTGNSDRQTKYTTMYNQIPVSQAGSMNMRLGAGVFNFSDEPLSGAMVTASVSGAGTFTGTSNTTTFNNFGEADSLSVTSTFTPSAEGSYTVNFAVSADSTDDYPVDNELEASFNVTERTFGWDDGEVGGGSSWSNGGHSMFSLLEFFADDTVSAIEFGIWSSATFASDDQAVVEVGIWEADWEIENGDTVNVQLGTQLFQPAFRVMSASEYTDGSNNNLIRVELESPVAVPAGEYLVGYKNSSGVIRTATSDLGWTPLGSWVDVDSDGSIDGWADLLPIIHVETWSNTLCATTNMINIPTITCNPDEWTADIEVETTGGAEPYGYAWSTGDEEDMINVDAEGSYVVTVTDADFCTKVDTIDVFNGDIDCNLATGKIGNASFSFTVLPNPNNGVFTVAFEAAKSESVNVELQSIKGDVVYSQAMNISNGTTKSIDLNGLASGVYVMKVANETGTTFQKIIIE